MLSQTVTMHIRLEEVFPSASFPWIGLTTTSPFQNHDLARNVLGRWSHGVFLNPEVTRPLTCQAPRLSYLPPPPPAISFVPLWLASLLSELSSILPVTIPSANKTGLLVRMTGRTGKPQPVEMTATWTMSTTRTRGT